MSLLGPYNEHLARDVGGLTGTAVLAATLLLPDRSAREGPAPTRTAPRA